MFNLNHSEGENKSDNNKLKSDWLSFFSDSRKDSMLNSLAADNKFIQEDLKIRAMAAEILEKEFGRNITNIKNYDFLLDSIVNRVKKNQLDSFETDKEQA